MRRFLTSLASFVSWHRRAIGALLAAAAVLLTVSALRAPTPTTPVLVIATDLPAGHTLTAADVSQRHIPTEALPDETFTDAEPPLGRPLAVDLSAGTVLQKGFLIADRVAAPGRAIVPISIVGDGVRALLSPGQAITLVAQGPEGTHVLTGDARVVALPPTDAPTGQLGAATSQPSSTLLVDVPQADAAMVASLGQGAGLSIVLGRV